MLPPSYSHRLTRKRVQQSGQEPTGIILPGFQARFYRLISSVIWGKLLTICKPQLPSLLDGVDDKNSSLICPRVLDLTSYFHTCDK